MQQIARLFHPWARTGKFTDKKHRQRNFGEVCDRKDYPGHSGIANCQISCEIARKEPREQHPFALDTYPQHGRDSDCIGQPDNRDAPSTARQFNAEVGEDPKRCKTRHSG